MPLKSPNSRSSNKKHIWWLTNALKCGECIVTFRCRAEHEYKALDQSGWLAYFILGHFKIRTFPFELFSWPQRSDNEARRRRRYFEADDERCDEDFFCFRKQVNLSLMQLSMTMALLVPDDSLLLVLCYSKTS